MFNRMRHRGLHHVRQTKHCLQTPHQRCPACVLRRPVAVCPAKRLPGTVPKTCARLGAGVAGWVVTRGATCASIACCSGVAFATQAWRPGARAAGKTCRLRLWCAGVIRSLLLLPLRCCWLLWGACDVRACSGAHHRREESAWSDNCVFSVGVCQPPRCAAGGGCAARRQKVAAVSMQGPPRC